MIIHVNRPADLATIDPIELPSVPRIGDDVEVDGVDYGVIAVGWTAGSPDVWITLR